MVEDRSFHLLEAIAATIASAVLGSTAASAVTVRVRKLAVPVDADLDFAQVRDPPGARLILREPACLRPGGRAGLAPFVLAPIGGPINPGRGGPERRDAAFAQPVFVPKPIGERSIPAAAARNGGTRPSLSPLRAQTDR